MWRERGFGREPFSKKGHRLDQRFDKVAIGQSSGETPAGLSWITSLNCCWKSILESPENGQKW